MDPEIEAKLREFLRPTHCEWCGWRLGADGECADCADNPFDYGDEDDAMGCPADWGLDY